MARQVRPHERWPSGDRIHLAALSATAQELERRYGLTFSEEVDDLGVYKLAAIELADTSQVWLEYRDAPEMSDETLALADAAADVDSAIVQLLDELALTPDELAWISPRVDLDRVQRHSRAARSRTAS